MREKEKPPENQLSDQEILSLQEKDFRLLMLKMMQDIGNKPEAKIDNLQQILSKEIQDRESTFFKPVEGKKDNLKTQSGSSHRGAVVNESD